MKIKSAQFIKGIVDPTQDDEDKKPHIAVIGRSNVGKSSFINTLTNQKNLARTSSTPGATKQVNIFLINKAFYLDDLPGYVYAKLSKQARQKLEDLILDYLNYCPTLQQVILLVDAKIGPTKLDHEIIEWLQDNKIKTIIILSKSDKAKLQSISKIKADLKKLLPQANIIPFSAPKKMGVKETLQALHY